MWIRPFTLLLLSLTACSRVEPVDGTGLLPATHAFFPIAPTTPHALGKVAQDGAISCESCHGQGETFQNPSCTGCHEHRQAGTDPDGSRGMDELHAGNADYRYDSAACLSCHRAGIAGELSRAEHAQHFPIEAGSHESIACSECHPTPGARKVVTCIGCHRDTDGDGKGQHEVGPMLTAHGSDLAGHGYAWDTTACLTCHPASEVPGKFDHEPLYKLQPPSGNGQHVGLRCSQCHASKDNRRATLLCTSCHQPTSASDPREVHGQERLGAVHAGIPGYIWAPSSCIGCHTDGTKGAAQRTLDHLWFPIAAGSKHALGSNGGQLECSHCHTTPGDYDAPVDCISCHQSKDDLDGAGARPVHGQARMSDQHSGVESYRFQSAACLECHPNAEPVGNIAHLRFPIDALSAHRGITCSDCHLGTAPKSDVSQLNCAGCHRAEVNLSPTLPQLHAGIPGYAEDPATCYGCHPSSEPVGRMDHEKFFPLAAGSAHASAAYLAAATASQNRCSACHLSRTDRSQNLCAQCHATVPTAVVGRPVDTHGRVRDFVNASADCKACHAEATVPDLATHRAFSFNHEGARCRQCHSNLNACLGDPACYNETQLSGESNTLVKTAMRTDKPWAVDWNQYACLACHKHRKSKEEAEHQGETRNGFAFRSYADPGCDKCH